MERVTSEFVRGLIDFAPTEEAQKRGYADYQLEGTVALFNMLQDNRCAYLADEVGMGKTYVALGVMALTRYLNPKARILVLTPRENIQRKWIKELQNFVRLNWMRLENRVKSLQGTPAWEPVLCNSVLEFAREALLHSNRDFFLRMTSFSLRLKQAEDRQRLRKEIRALLPWLSGDGLSAHSPEAFRTAFGQALNAAVPEADLVVVDEGHNLKHGLRRGGSIRNHVLAHAFGHEQGRDPARPWFGPRAKRLLLLSATPFEEDYSAIQRQFSLFGFGDAPLVDGTGKPVGNMADLADPELSPTEKRKVAGRVMVRRVSGLQIAGQLHTKNMYRQEWRQGGLSQHDDPMRVEDPKQQLVVALMQKKVAEVLQKEDFNNHFQIGMLSSFESFLESVATAKKSSKSVTGDDQDDEPTFDGDQTRTHAERQGIDTDAVQGIADSYWKKFRARLPHPKLDTTARSLQETFQDGEKALVFVRRIATVDELAARLDAVFDTWLRSKMEQALPDLKQQIGEFFEDYDRERQRRPGELMEDLRDPGGQEEPTEQTEDRGFVTALDSGSAETFFAWFFRGKEPPGILSGAAFQKNRLASTSSAYSVLFEDDYVAWLLGRPTDPLLALAESLGVENTELHRSLREAAFGHFKQRTRHKDGYPRLYVYEAYQVAALEALSRERGDLARHAEVVLQERFPGPVAQPLTPPGGFPGPEAFIGLGSFFTGLTSRSGLRMCLWPDEPREDFRATFRRREQRRELLGSMARLGAPYIDLYLLAIRSLGSFQLRTEASVERPAEKLAEGFLDLLEQQKTEPGFHAYRELAAAASSFDLLMAVNFPEAPQARIQALPGIFGATLNRQVPVGRMAGGVNKRLVKQFRMPGFPLALITTDVLQEGEDLHTFCRKVLHYGITWTPSAMEQRTGRVDRIGSLTQRHLDGAAETPDSKDWLQVYFPHLQDTVEVLQIRRVLNRMNRFLQLTHLPGHGMEEWESTINTAREILEEAEVIPQFKGQLKSAFPVQPEWLKGPLKRAPEGEPEGQNRFAHLDRLWKVLLESYSIRPHRTSEARIRIGEAMVCQAALVEAQETTRGEPCQFRLELRSQAAGDATFLRCTVALGTLDLSKDTILDRLYWFQQAEGMPKICVRPDTKGKLNHITVENDILFHSKTTQLEELIDLIERTIGPAVPWETEFGNNRGS